MKNFQEEVYKEVLKMLSLGSPLIKDALTKAILMSKEQLWLQSPNNSSEKSAH